VLAGELTLDEFASGRIIVPRVKIVADGSIQGFTGYLSQPYHRPHKGDEDYRGYPAVVRDALFEQIEGLYRQRVQVAIHGNGDASIEDALDAIETAAAKYPWSEARPLIIHAQMTRKDQIDRMADLGVTPSFFSAHTFFWGDRHGRYFYGSRAGGEYEPREMGSRCGRALFLAHGYAGNTHEAPSSGLEPRRAENKNGCGAGARSANRPHECVASRND